MSASQTPEPDYELLIAALNIELGIPFDYAERRGLILHAEADDDALVCIGLNSSQSEVRLTIPATAAWHRMQSAAADNGIVLLPLSGFRSVARQTEIIREKLAAGQSLLDILRVIAAPGYSEHHTGRALDIGTPDDPPMEEEFALTAAYRWLNNHAGSFGFHLSYPRDNPHGIVFEPWHWLWSAD